MLNLLTNPSFEGGTWRKTHSGEVYSEINVPLGWTAFWNPNMGRPEMKVISAKIPYLDPPRVPEGEQAVQSFTFYRTHDAGLYQQVSVPSGATLRLSALAHAWYSQRDDAHLSEYQDKEGVWHQIAYGEPGMLLEVGIDPTGGTDWEAAHVKWQGGYCYNSPQELPLFVDGVSATVTVFLRSIPQYPFKHCDAYWDDVKLEVVAQSEPEPEKVDYVVVANLLPQNTTKAELAIVLERTYAQKQTVLYSDQDAARLVVPGLPGSYAMVWNPERWTQGSIVQALKGRGVADVRTTWFGEQPEPPTGPVYPTPGPLIGLHSQRPKEGWFDYYKAVKPGVFKGFQLGMCVEAKQASPSTLVVYRHHVTDDAGWIHRADLKISAREFLDLYSLDFETHAVNSGLTIAQVLEHVDVIESVNEVIGTHDPDLEPSVAFEIEFMRALEERYGNQVKAGVLTVPVGNPHETEVVKLLPAARAAYEGGHYLAPHPYWAGKRGTSYLLPNWQWFAGRWQEWDKLFRTYGVYPLYYGGEAAVVYSEDGWNLNSGLGWKSCGPFSEYIEDLLDFDRLTRVWNAMHGNRFRGATVFCYGSYGWENFDFEPGDLKELQEALSG